MLHLLHLILLILPRRLSALPALLCLGQLGNCLFLRLVLLPTPSAPLRLRESVSLCHALIVPTAPRVGVDRLVAVQCNEMHTKERMARDLHRCFMPFAIIVPYINDVA